MIAKDNVTSLGLQSNVACRYILGDSIPNPNPIINKNNPNV